MPASSGYEFFAHTADTGIRAHGPQLQDVLTGLADGLKELLAEDSRIEPREARPVRLEADDAASLVLVWLQQLLFWFSTERFLPAAYEFTEVTPTTLRGAVRGGLFDPRRHTQGREVKAITRHRLEVWQADGQWWGQVIVDI